MARGPNFILMSRAANALRRGDSSFKPKTDMPQKWLSGRLSIACHDTTVRRGNSARFSCLLTGINEGTR